MKDTITSYLQESIAVKERILNDAPLLTQIESAAKILIHAIESAGTIYLCGNGGSACDAMHFCEELVARYKRDRQGIRAMHFLDPSALTCWSNDYAYESGFERYAQTFCTKSDCLVGISTSGNSHNVLLAVEAAKKQGCSTIALLGKDGGKIAPQADVSLIVPSEETDRIQEAHICLIHIFCELLEQQL
ncbi:MAG: SIS domain-containing protein [Bdellovibrionales bacterium]|nr:SIS domain-containing protein [Bdellovibrionales bacterium]